MRGNLETIVGAMFAGKTSELLKRILWAKHQNKKIIVIKPSIDNRYSNNKIITHNDLSHECYAMKDWATTLKKFIFEKNDVDILFLDEIQFMDTKDTLNNVEIILNKGKKDGVEIGSSVVGPGGLLGRVNNSSLLTSSVNLLTSPESRVGVWVERIQSHALLVGTGNDYPKLIFYTKDLDVKVGDLVISSPASTLLPPNIPIGIIHSVDPESRSKKTANVSLFAKPQAIDWVQILKSSI